MADAGDDGRCSLRADRRPRHSSLGAGIHPMTGWHGDPSSLTTLGLGGQRRLPPPPPHPRIFRVSASMAAPPQHSRSPTPGMGSIRPIACFNLGGQGRLPAAAPKCLVSKPMADNRLGLKT